MAETLKVMHVIFHCKNFKKLGKLPEPRKITCTRLYYQFINFNTRISSLQNVLVQLKSYPKLKVYNFSWYIFSILTEDSKACSRFSTTLIVLVDFKFMFSRNYIKIVLGSPSGKITINSNYCFVTVASLKLSQNILHEKFIICHILYRQPAFFHSSPKMILSILLLQLGLSIGERSGECP